MAGKPLVPSTTTTKRRTGVTLPMSTPFRERNPVVIGAISLAVLAALILLGLPGRRPAPDRRWRHLLRRLQRGRRPQGQRRGPGRRRPGRQGRRRRAGRRPRQGDLQGRERRRLRQGHRRRRSRIKTLLGRMYLALEPAGSGQLAEESTIPVERTTSPYDVVEAFAGLAETSERIDTDQLTQSLTTLADLGRATPPTSSGRRSRASRRSPNARVARRADQHAADQPREGLRRARRPLPTTSSR